MRLDTLAARRVRRLIAPLLLATLAACGGGDFAELFVKLITARFVPGSVSLPAGGTVNAQLEVSCDRAGLDTPFGRLGLLVKLDPEQRLAVGVTAALTGAVPPDAEGFRLYPCTGATTNPDLRVALIPLQVTASASMAPATTTLIGFVKVEPLLSSEPSKDSTLAELAITVTAVDGGGVGGAFDTNLLVNPDFSAGVDVGTVPSALGNWRGDLSASVGAEQEITPRSAPNMLKFLATGTTPSANLVSSQQWQIVDLGAFRDDIAAGRVTARAAGWFNRVDGETTDRRFDLRVLAYDGSPADLPTRYAAATHLAQQTTSLLTSAFSWQEAVASLALPPGTTYVLVEIYAYEDVVNETEGPEFAGHYADDISLVLTRN